jgi:erythrin-vacuolar iron transport family protein
MQNLRMRDFVDFAIKNEMAAAAFYQGCADQARFAVQKTMFNELAATERGHEKRLRDFLSSGKVAAFSERAAGDLMISDFLVEKKIGPDSDPQDIFIFAMKDEQKACDLYTRLAALEQDPAVKALFVELAATEKGHKFSLEKEYEKVMMKEI